MSKINVASFVYFMSIRQELVDVGVHKNHSLCHRNVIKETEAHYSGDFSGITKFFELN